MEQKISDSFARQHFMTLLGATLLQVQPGEVSIGCGWREELTQQNGYFHAGVLTSIVDSACGYAAHTMMPPDTDVLSVEFKINLLRAATSPRIIATGKVLKAGKTLVVCEGTVTDESGETVFAKMLATMMVMKKINSR